MDSGWATDYSHIVVKMVSKTNLIDNYGIEQGIKYWEQGKLWCVINTVNKQIVGDAHSLQKAANDEREYLIDQWENDCDTSRF